MARPSEAGAGRRQFLGSAGAGLLLLKPETVFGTQANSAIEIGIVGCGGRGNWIMPFFVEFGARVVALADPFRDRLETLQEKTKVDPSRLYGGLDGFKGLAASKLDAVVIESPPYFHPEQAEAAVAAGKHVFLAKPVAVDVSGCQRIAAAGRQAEGKRSFLVDFQTRAQPAFQEAAARVQQGAIGTPVMGHVFYHTGRLRRQDKPGMSAAEARLRNWTFDIALSGDVIVEQHIHVLDVANWYMQSHPVRACGTGGRKARVDVGDCWDHFIVTYWYPNDVRMDFSSNQFLKGFHDMCIRFYGTAGTVDSHYGAAVRITGDNPWPGIEKDDTFRQGAQTNVRNFVESIRTGKYLNNVAESVQSNLTSILGRMTAYKEQPVTWDQMMRSGERLEAKLVL
ncbi:MAG: Gfo/Idh/MocA family oxidoreductase [Acidobacteria bacterium]|nr:Gfo/Idh/MocA family oxidoreductase [Acidobacteriota bacterium]